MKTPFLAALAVLSLAAPAMAADTAGKAPSLTVRYADLNLRDAKDAQVMLHRIRKAASEVCGAGAGGYDATLRFETCHRETVERAVAALDAPAVRTAQTARAVRQDVAWLP
jgi:UrcA family protein